MGSPTASDLKTGLREVQASDRAPSSPGISNYWASATLAMAAEVKKETGRGAANNQVASAGSRANGMAAGKGGGGDPQIEPLPWAGRAEHLSQWAGRQPRHRFDLQRRVCGVGELRAGRNRRGLCQLLLPRTLRRLLTHWRGAFLREAWYPGGGLRAHVYAQRVAPFARVGRLDSRSRNVPRSRYAAPQFEKAPKSPTTITVPISLTVEPRAGKSGGRKKQKGSDIDKSAGDFGKFGIRVDDKTAVFTVPKESTQEIAPQSSPVPTSAASPAYPSSFSSSPVVEIDLKLREAINPALLLNGNSPLQHLNFDSDREIKLVRIEIECDAGGSASTYCRTMRLREGANPITDLDSVAFPALFDLASRDAPRRMINFTVRLSQGFGMGAEVLVEKTLSVQWMARNEWLDRRKLWPLFPLSFSLTPESAQSSR